MINQELEKIYKRILVTYPFLGKKEKNDFEKVGRTIIEKSLSRKNLQLLLDLLKNPHAYLWVWRKSTNRNSIKKKKFTYKLYKKILILTVPSWSNKLSNLDKKLIHICTRYEKKYNGIIIDVRNNKGGSSRIAHSFAGIFFKKPIIYGRFKKRRVNHLFSVIGKIAPNGKIYIDKPIAILISNECFSSNELFLAPFKESSRAILIGEKTRGGSGNPIQEEVKIRNKKIIVLIPTWRFFLIGSSDPIEKTKINPDTTYKKRDILNFAIKRLQSGIHRR